MKLINRTLTLLSMMMLFASLSFAKSDKEKSFSIYQGKTEVAQVKIRSGKNEIRATIERKGQSDHTFVKSLADDNINATIGGEKLFAYNNKSGEYQINSEKSNVSQLKWSEIQTFAGSVNVKSTLAEDMKILRAVRVFDGSAPTRSFELAYVILTADESIYWSENSDYTVKGEMNSKIKIGARQAGCGSGCDSRLQS